MCKFQETSEAWWAHTLRSEEPSGQHAEAARASRCLQSWVLRQTLVFSARSCKVQINTPAYHLRARRSMTKNKGQMERK